MTPTCPVPLATDRFVLLGHGSGGKLSAELMDRVFLPALGGEALSQLEDAAVLPVRGGSIAFTTDSFVVTPRFFPGGDLGSLAVHGTVNDLAMVGARPRYLAAAFILEEGMPIDELEKLAWSLGEAALACGVEVVAGDTKVVNRGAGDGCYITTTGVGEPIRPGLTPSCGAARPGDLVLLSGPIGLHGIAILAARGELGIEVDVESDSAPLHWLVEALIRAIGPSLHTLRDPTRGGVASALNEIAAASGVSIEIDESRIPVPPPVAAACEVLGLDPLYVANEGKFLALVAPDAADDALAALRGSELGADAAIIGRVAPCGVNAAAPLVARTRSGGMRIVQKLAGEQLPRIC
jgi:hydrogenase expression/formation protein HypE